MDIKTVAKSSLLAIAATGTIAGGYLFLSPNFKSQYCKIDLKDVSQENMLDKMIIEVNKREIKEKEVELGCDYEPVVDEKNTTKAYKVKQENCVKKSKDDYIKMKDENFAKMKELDKYEPDEAKKIMAEFTKIWNYNLFRVCGLK
jgi:hypothetical protein